ARGAGGARAGRPGSVRARDTRAAHRHDSPGRRGDPARRRTRVPAGDRVTRGELRVITDDDDKLAELANICAGHAASTLPLLLDPSLLTRVPRLRTLPAGRPLRSLFLREERVGGIFADLAGPFEARAALLLPAGAVEEVVARVSGKEHADGSTLAVLAEVGN